MKKYHLYLLPLLLLITSCNYNNASPKYQISTTNKGKVFRLDTQSGDIYQIKDGHLLKIHKGTMQLVVGERYKDENGKIFKYTGKGKLTNLTSEESADELADKMLNEMGL